MMVYSVCLKCKEWGLLAGAPSRVAPGRRDWSLVRFPVCPGRPERVLCRVRGCVSVSRACDFSALANRRQRGTRREASHTGNRVP